MAKEFIIAIELGSSKIIGIAGKKNSDGSISILAVAQEDASACIRKGVIYNIEKTVCDFIRNRGKLDLESFVKCVTWYSKRKDKNVNRLIQYARIMKIEDKVNSLMEVLLNEN